MEGYDFLKGFVIGVMVMFVLSVITISYSYREHDTNIKCECHKIIQEK